MTWRKSHIKYLFSFSISLKKNLNAPLTPKPFWKTFEITGHRTGLVGKKRKRKSNRTTRKEKKKGKSCCWHFPGKYRALSLFRVRSVVSQGYVLVFCYTRLLLHRREMLRFTGWLLALKSVLLFRNLERSRYETGQNRGRCQFTEQIWNIVRFRPITFCFFPETMLNRNV